MYGGDGGSAPREASATGLAILRLMAAAGLERTPEAFGLFHAYAENRCPELNEQLDALIAAGAPLSPAFCQELYRRYLAGAAAPERSSDHGGAFDLPDVRAELRRLQDRLAAAEAELGRDHLTGLANRRHLEVALAAAIAACRAQRRTLSVAVADIDRFKAINDRYGHAVGDAVLRLVGTVLASSAPVRLAARLGGDEFILVLPDLALAPAQRIVEGLRRQLAQRRFVVRGTGRVVGTVSLSAGVAERCGDESAEDLLRRADAALYAAKRGGRNAVAIAALEPRPAAILSLDSRR